MRTDICKECVWDKFLKTDYFQSSGLRTCNFHSLFYLTGWVPFFVSGFHNEFKGSVNVFGECCWNLFLQLLFLITYFCYQGIQDFRIPHGFYTDSLLAIEKVSITYIWNSNTLAKYIASKCGVCQVVIETYRESHLQPTKPPTK